MPTVVILILLGALLVALVLVAAAQRRGVSALAATDGAVADFAQPSSLPPPLPTPPVDHGAQPNHRTSNQVSIGRIAAGVWLGIWLFVLSVAIPAIFIVQHVIDSRR